MNEKPLTVCLGLHLYKSTRNKVLIEHMSNLNLCISYDKILKIENSIGNAVSSQKIDLWCVCPTNYRSRHPCSFCYR